MSAKALKFLNSLNWEALFSYLPNPSYPEPGEQEFAVQQPFGTDRRWFMCIRVNRDNSVHISISQCSELLGKHGFV